MPRRQRVPYLKLDFSNRLQTQNRKRVNKLPPPRDFKREIALLEDHNAFICKLTFTTSIQNLAAEYVQAE
ncbi:MAG TPA: hypothetical protein VF393_01150 [archaeon]